jgi:hypothetical protein
MPTTYLRPMPSKEISREEKNKIIHPKKQIDVSDIL